MTSRETADIVGMIIIERITLAERTSRPNGVPENRNIESPKASCRGRSSQSRKYILKTNRPQRPVHHAGHRL